MRQLRFASRQSRLNTHLAALFLTAASLSIAALTACAPSAAPPEKASAQKLVIAVQPTSTPEQLTTDAKDIEKFLEARLPGVDVDIVFPTTFAGVIEALRFGHAQAAFMSAWPAALAQKHASAQVVLAEVREVVIDETKVEAPYYFSYWVVKKDSPVTSLSDLRGKIVSLPSPISTSGYVAPLARLVELGLLPTPTDGKESDPKKYFGDVLFAGGYAQGWEALKNGQVDATVIAGDVSEKLYREVLANTRIIETQGPIPSHGVVFSKNLEEPLRSQLKDALLELGKPESQALMRKFISGIFVAFKPTTGEEHLASLNKYLSLTQFQFVERLR
ncbi:MAG TPA: phosphate/phosphite/phosphonate ABC transporter substrate-binding protein [Dehalococcoidia bacterium]|nr:phosphate/phosphite/phosphonate ABC transporter substrate-binding protein [Dehalococcoidia bacterium]